MESDSQISSIHRNVRILWNSHSPEERTGIGRVSRSLAQRLVEYYELPFKCPFCGITVIYPRRLRSKIEVEKEFVMRCPKCNERIILILKPEIIEVESEQWNPSRR